MRYQQYNNRFYYILIFLIFFLMFGGFRVLAVLLGLVFAFLPLIIFFFVLFNLFTIINRNHMISQYINHQTAPHNKFVELLTRVAVHVIHADGKVEEVEIQTFKNFFMTRLDFSQQAVLWVEDVLKRELKAPHPLNELMAEVNAQFNYDTKLVLLDFLYHIASSDFQFSDTEAKLLGTIAGLMHIAAADHAYIRARHLRSESTGKTQSREKYYRVLGLSPGASQDDIKQAYRKLVKKFHPDVVAHLGEEFKQANEKKLKEVTEAYEKLKKRA